MRSFTGFKSLTVSINMTQLPADATKVIVLRKDSLSAILDSRVQRFQSENPGGGPPGFPVVLRVPDDATGLIFLNQDRTMLDGDMADGALLIRCFELALCAVHGSCPQRIAMLRPCKDVDVSRRDCWQPPAARSLVARCTLAAHTPLES